jgi:hypothetical protein
MKQTAVDWVFEQLDEQVYKVDYDNRRISISISFEDMMTLKKEAKEMEKQQIIDARIDGDENYTLVGNKRKEYAEQYYKETYGEK